MLARWAIVIEQSKTGYSAYVPGLLGCIAVGETFDEVSQLIGEAIEFHVEGLRRDGHPIP